MVNAPVFKDTYYTTSANSLDYAIIFDGITIFSGRAYRLPDADEVKININKVCQAYLNQDFIPIPQSGSTINEGAIGMFELVDGVGDHLEWYTFLHCYDYDFDWTGQTGVTLSQPILDTYTTGVKVLNTMVTRVGNNVETIVRTTASDPVKTNACCDGALYYVNARGGWDTMCFFGSVVKRDNITAYTTDRSFNNNTREFEANRYLSEIKTQYELTTGWLNDEQSANIAKNLVGSNLVYFHNLKEGKIVPVVINDNSVVYQTYQSNGKQLCQYRINIQESQSKLRR